MSTRFTSETTASAIEFAHAAEVLSQSITLPFSNKISKSRFLKAGKSIMRVFLAAYHCSSWRFLIRVFILFYLARTAMTERISSWDQYDLSKRGVPTEEVLRVYEAWGKGGFGIILTGMLLVILELIPILLLFFFFN